MNIKFSIVAPIYSQSNNLHYRTNKIDRLIQSIHEQSFKDFELILINDGSPDPALFPKLEEWARKDERIVLVNQNHQQRVATRNNGMKLARGEWICWADSDDQYTRDYLWVCDETIKSNPEFPIFIFGALIKRPEGITVRHALDIPEEGDGHEWFGSGRTNTGSFIFKRELLEDTDNWIPNCESPYEFAAQSRVDLRLDPNDDRVENPTGAFTDGIMRRGLSLGNPWGDDWLQIFKLTRHNKAKSIDIPIYIIYPRGSEQEPEFLGETT